MCTCFGKQKLVVNENPQLTLSQTDRPAISRCFASGRCPELLFIHTKKLKFAHHTQKVWTVCAIEIEDRESIRLKIDGLIRAIWRCLPRKSRANFGVFILSRLKRGVALRPPRSSQRTAEPTARGFERKK